MQPHFRDDLQQIRDLLNRADEEKSGKVIDGLTIIAADRLADLVERLYERIIDLERVQNERAAE